MSRRRSGDPSRAEVVLTCRGCGIGAPLASIYLDQDGDPALDGKPSVVRGAQYSFVSDLDNPPERADVPQKVSLFCRRGHELQVNLPTMMDDLRRMPPGRVWRAI
jgi:hypothetical protein